MTTKTDVLKKIYFDKAGFGSMKTTYQDAKAKDKSITVNDVKKFFDEYVEQKKQQRGYNTFISPRHTYEYQVDLFFINDLLNQKYKVGLLMIDAFSKYMTVIPIKTKGEGDVAAGIIEGFVKMGGSPEILYTDDESALSTDAMKKYLKDNDIKHIITRSHAHIAERAIRTFKDSLYKRIDHAKDDEKQWVDLVFEILLTYNNKLVHSTTGMTPDDARKKKNELDVWTNTFINSKQNRKYPNLEKGDKVKILRKKGITEKERSSVWSDNAYEVEDVFESKGQTFYKVSNGKDHTRHELLKVK